MAWSSDWDLRPEGLLPVWGGLEDGLSVIDDDETTTDPEVCVRAGF